MRETIFNAIIDVLNTITSLQGADGTTRIYKWPNSSPDGYPAVFVASTGLKSKVSDTSRDIRTYNYLIMLVQEKMPDFFGPEKAEQVARIREDDILAAFDANNRLGVAGVIRTTPINDVWGYTDKNTRIVIQIDIAVEVSATITV